MPSYWTILTATLPVFIVIGIGFAMHRGCWLGEEIEVGTMRLVLNFFVPCLILSLIPGNHALETFSSAGWAVGCGFGLVVCGFGLAWVASRVVGLKSGEGRRTFVVGCGVQNYGYLPLPILAELFPDDAGPIALVFVHGVGVELAMWTAGLAILSGTVGLRSVINGPFLAVVVALLLNYTGAYRFIPEFIDRVFDMMGACAIPMAILMIGATMGRFFRPDLLHDAVRTTLASLVVRLVLAAGIILAAARFLPISPDLRWLLVVQAAMPAAVFPIMLARLYGGRPQVAIQVVLATSAVSLVTAPLVIAWGLRWIAAGP